jgi:hypothetical protein
MCANENESQSVMPSLTPKREVARWNRAGGTIYLDRHKPKNTQSSSLGSIYPQHQDSTNS